MSRAKDLRWAAAPRVVEASAHPAGLRVVLEGVYQRKNELNVYLPPALATEEVLGWKFGQGQRLSRSDGWITMSLSDGLIPLDGVWNPCHTVHKFANDHGFEDEWALYYHLRDTGEVLKKGLAVSSVTTLWEHLDEV